ncbi:MAG: phosphonate ABC transporter, permease protein PhnE [Alphaproteobacteria bacterium]
MTAATPSADRTAVTASVRKQSRLHVIVFFATLAYLAYAWVDFDVNGLIAKSRPERAVLLATDAVAHKVHVTADLRRGGLVTAIEGERTATYDEPPPWVTMHDEDRATTDLGDGYSVDIDGANQRMRFTVPGYGTVEVAVIKRRIVTTLPHNAPPPPWMRVTDRKFDARPTLARRVQVSVAKIEVHRYFLGWENFFFPFNSDLQDLSAGQLIGLMLDDRRLHEDASNAAYVFETFWDNPDWQHGAVFVALLETVMMALLGTLTAAFVGLPLALLAASNFTPAMTLRFFVRRLFDLLRGIDMLIWSLIFIRAFGLGPLTGALAIAFTDTGTLGKLFSEALENIDRRQVEGVAATGAGRLQRYRFGVIPQILPIFLSQVLYYLESNTRSATVIGALGAGGIGLMLVETMRTARDWENTFYIIILTIGVVIAMDALSSALRRRLIHGRDDHARSR